MNVAVAIRRPHIGSVAAASTGPQGPAGPSGTGQAEMAYAQITSNATIGTSVADVSGLTVTFTAGTRPIMLELYVPQLFSTTAGSTVSWLITDSSNNQKGSGGQVCASASVFGSYFAAAAVVKTRLGSLTSGTSYTFKVRANGTVSHTAGVGSTSPAYLQALEV